jgi:chorismate mutase
MIIDGENKGLNEEFVLKIYKAIHQESIAHQEIVFKS